MTSAQHVDGILVQWGERLFYPSNRIVKTAPTPRLDALTRRKAAVIRKRIEAVVRRVPQVMVKVTGGGRGMAAIAAHFRYISKNGRLNIEDDREVVRTGKEALHALADQWRFGGSLIPEEGHRREAFNIMLSMPAGTDARLLQKAAREFAKVELAGHRYVMVLHEHQANPHVHLSVRAEGASGKRLNPRKTDLHRWRETFAEKLRGWGIEAEATRQASRGESRNFEPLWRVKAKQDGRLNVTHAATKTGPQAQSSRAEAMVSWAHILKALAASEVAEDRLLAKQLRSFVHGGPFVQERVRHQRSDLQRGIETPLRRAVPEMQPGRSDVDRSR
ncbi:relaxase/mobilization nuclease domain-containing protein [Roseateles sp.]|uniref:relaxase/mobilization nuclease domain-containing protein n=1 Tax=Roseateles sp. TaxID=1971397 RepID=UPI0032668FB5